MNLSTALKQFFVENDFQYLAKRITIIRHDGICVYSNSSNDYESATICALVSGLWQAAKALSSLSEKREDFSDFRLSFDTTENGLHVLPFNYGDEEFYICAIFNDVSNPAKLKRDIWFLKENLSVFISDIPLSIDEKIDRGAYLFKDISDDEIDKLFEFNGI